MDEPLYPHAGAEVARKRRELAPGPLDAFKAFSASVFADGALDGKTTCGWSGLPVPFHSQYAMRCDGI